MKLKRIVCLLLTLLMVLPMLVACGGDPGKETGDTGDTQDTGSEPVAKINAAAEYGKDVVLYVSPDGNDANDGKEATPLATVAGARDLIRRFDRAGLTGITVLIADGNYPVSSAIGFGEQDSGTKSCPITYRAVNQGKATLNGGILLTDADFAPVTDAGTLARLSADAQTKVKVVDLSKFNLTQDMLGRVKPLGSYNSYNMYDGDWTSGNTIVDLYYNDTRMQLARYPNEGWLKTGYVLSQGLCNKCEGYGTIRNPEPEVYRMSRELADKLKSWKTFDEVWMYGYFTYDWADSSTPIGRVDYENMEFSPKFVAHYGAQENCDYYFFNVFEELDAPGEWYLDRENLLLYIYPEDESFTIDMALSSGLINMSNADYLTFDGLVIMNARGNALNVTGNHNTLIHCTVKDITDRGLNLNGTENTVTRCEFCHTGGMLINVDGGDRETLRHANNLISNNLLHDYCEINQMNVAVGLYGVGNTVSHNEIYDGPGIAIGFGGNDLIMEYNYIHDVCLLVSDSGAIYAGRRWDWYGCEINYNRIEHLGSEGFRPQGIYLDDCMSGVKVWGNLLIEIPGYPLCIGGGHDHIIDYNIIIGLDETNGRKAIETIHYDARGWEGIRQPDHWFEHTRQGLDLWTNLYASPWQSDVWKKAYPEMSKLSDDWNDIDGATFGANPYGSELKYNMVFCGSPRGIDDIVKKYSDVEDDNYYFESAEFANYMTVSEDGQYTMKDKTAVVRNCPKLYKETTKNFPLIGIEAE